MAVFRTGIRFRATGRQDTTSAGQQFVNRRWRQESGDKRDKRRIFMLLRTLRAGSCLRLRATVYGIYCASEQVPRRS